MTQPPLHTTQLHQWLERMRGGDLAARDELLRGVGDRLERLARKMLGKFPAMHRWVETGDVLNSAVLRLFRALETVQPDTVRDFFGLAAEQMRRELLDLARKFHGPHGLAANHASNPPTDDTQRPGPDPADRRDDPAELERWCAFHEDVEKLPVEEREVVGLVFYHGWTQTQVAELFGVTERTVRRWWRSALAKLHREPRGDGTDE